MNTYPHIFELNEFPLVSVIVPAYNAQEHIGKTLQSLIHQSYAQLEIIVTDDGSSDRTAEIVKKAIKKDNRIKLFQQPNKGVAAARNLAISQSRGSFIAPVDADDICFPDKISKLVDSFQKSDSPAGLAYSWSATIDEWGNVFGIGQRSEFDGEVFEHLLFQNFPGNGSCTLIRKDCFDVVGLYNTNFFSQKAQGCEDHDIYLRIAEKFEFKLVREFLTGYRKTKHSMSNNYRVMERSKKLVFRNQKIRTPWVPAVVFNWASAYYSLWLSSLAGNMGCYYDSFTYLVKAAQYDPKLIQNTEYLRLLFSRLFFSPLKRGLKKMMPSYYCKCDNQKVSLQKAQQLIMTKGNILMMDFKKTSGFDPKRASLTLLREKRRMAAYHLVKKARIKNGYLVR